jgi:uroporphyrinogen decarboxylase
MNSRERVMCALKRDGSPDRVPLQFDLCRSLLELNDLIEIGLEVFNPVQPNVPGHDPEALKTQYGERLSFWGAIDQQQLLPFGTPSQIEADVAEKIRVLGRGGGYMCSPAHIVQSDTSLANVEAFIAAVRKHGVYR